MSRFQSGELHEGTTSDNREVEGSSPSGPTIITALQPGYLPRLIAFFGTIDGSINRLSTQSCREGAESRGLLETSGVADLRGNLWRFLELPELLPRLDAPALTAVNGRERDRVLGAVAIPTLDGAMQRVAEVHREERAGAMLLHPGSSAVSGGDD